MKYSGIGGQAVIEGIMMMKGEDYAVAVRRPDKEIEVKKDTYQSITKKAKILQLPFVRGVFRFADSMIIGMRSLTYSASFFEDDEDAEPGKFEQFLDRVFGEKLESAIMAAVLVISFILAIGIFMLLPLGIANLFKGVITSDHLMAVLEGVIRIAIFIIYIKLVSRMEDIRRTFMYHGAEHKTIFCYERGLELTVETRPPDAPAPSPVRYQLSLCGECGGGAGLLRGLCPAGGAGGGRQSLCADSSPSAPAAHCGGGDL